MKRKTILVFGMVGAIALAIPLQSSARGVITFEGAGITAQGEAVVVLGPGLDGTTKGIVIVGGKVVSLSCAKLVPNRTATGAAMPGATLYANGKLNNPPDDGKWLMVRALDGTNADQVGIVIDGSKPQGNLCGASTLRTRPLMAGQFISIGNPAI